MKYSAENLSLSQLDLTFSDVISGEIKDGALCLCLTGCCAEKYASGNTSGKKCRLPKLWVTLYDFTVNLAVLRGIPYVNLKDNTVKKEKDRALYKSEYAAFAEKLCGGGDIDIFSFAVAEKNGKPTVTAEINFEDDKRKWYGAEISCSKVCAEWEEYGEPVSEKLSLKQRAALLKENIPAMFMALGHRDTPALAKIAAGIALGYALSPVDLIPDFIPVLGYLDDVLILSGLIALAVKLIPDDVMAECRARAAEGRICPKKRWYYALPVIIIWLIIIGLIVRTILK